MKQLLFVSVATLVGTFGGIFVSPFYGIAIYYLFAVLRPQYLWAWALPPGMAWSYYVGIATILGTVRWGIGGGPVGSSATSEAEDAGRRRPTLAHGCILLFGLWVVLSSRFAYNEQVANLWLLEYTKIFVMFAVSAYVISTSRQIWLLMVIAASALGYIAYEVNVLYLFDSRMDIFYEGYGGLDNNGAALMLAMGVPLCLFAWEGTQHVTRWIFAALIPLLIHAVLMTYSRGAMLSLLIASPLLFARSRHRRQLSLAAVCLACALPVLAGAEIRTRFLSTREFKTDASAQGRFASWAAGMHIAMDHPIVGVGLRNADLLSQQYGADIEQRAIHNQYIQTAADTGFVGLGLYVSTYLATWRSLRRVRRSTVNSLDPEARRICAIASGAEVSLAIFCIGSFFLSLEVFELPYLLLLLGAQLPGVSGKFAEVGSSAVAATGSAVNVAPAIAHIALGPTANWRESVPKAALAHGNDGPSIIERGVFGSTRGGKAESVQGRYVIRPE